MKSFTLIEMILVVAVLAIIFGFSVPFLINFIERQDLDSATEELVSILKLAQNKSITAEKDSSWGIDFSEEGKYFLFFAQQGLVTPAGEYLLSKKINLTTNIHSLEFEKLSGQIKVPSEIILTIGNQKYTININQEGVIDYYKQLKTDN